MLKYTVQKSVTISPKTKYEVKLEGLPSNAKAFYTNTTGKSVEFSKGEVVPKDWFKILAITCTGNTMEL